MNLASGAGDLIFQSIYNQMDFSKINIAQTGAASFLGPLPAAFVGNKYKLSGETIGDWKNGSGTLIVSQSLSIKAVIFSTAANCVGGRNQNIINKAFRPYFGANQVLQTNNFLLLNAGGQVATDASTGKLR